MVYCPFLARLSDLRWGPLVFAHPQKVSFLFIYRVCYGVRMTPHHCSRTPWGRQEDAVPPPCASNFFDPLMPPSILFFPVKLFILFFADPSPPRRLRLKIPFRSIQLDFYFFDYPGACIVILFLSLICWFSPCLYFLRLTAGT